jgi:hypothetical protein
MDPLPFDRGNAPCGLIVDHRTTPTRQAPPSARMIKSFPIAAFDTIATEHVRDVAR